MWVRLDCTLASHRKLLRAGGDAAWFWVCGLAHANGHTTNGVIHRDDLVALYPCAEWSATKRRNLAAKLVEVGLWDVIDADSWMIHDYADHQSEAMSEAVEARREREREKKRTQRSAGKSMVSGNVSPGDTRGDTRGSPAVVPPRVPGVSPPSDRPTVRQTDEGEEELSPTPSGRVTVAPRPKAPKPVKPPPPFSVVEAVNAIAATAGARFAVGDPATWPGGWKIALAQHVRRFPDLGAWSLVGEWLAAGGGTSTPKGTQWASTNGLIDAMAQARLWDDGGRPDLIDERGFPVRAKPAEVDPWEAAAKAKGWVLT